MIVYFQNVYDVMKTHIFCLYLQMCSIHVRIAN